MKLKLKAIAAATTLALAGGHASAALTDAFGQSGTLFLAVWDTVTFETYVRDLGTDLNSFLPTSPRTAEAGFTQTFGNLAGSTLFTQTFGNNTASNIRWTVIGVDEIEGDGVGDGSRYVSAATSAVNIINGGIRGVAAQAVAYASALVNNAPGVDFTGAPAEFAYTGVGSEAIEAGGPNWGSFLLGTNNGQLVSTGFSSSAFWFAQTSNDAAGNDSGDGTGTRFGNSANFATLTLNSAGEVIYNLAAAGPGAEIPLPAAAWLMGAGLLALGGAARRRNQAAAA
jgi:hypothetical protein